MTASIPFSPRLFPLSPNNPTGPQSALSFAPRPLRPSHLPPRRIVQFASPEDRVSQGMLIALAAVTLPAAAYSLLQALSLVGNGTLQHAVNAFIP